MSLEDLQGNNRVDWHREYVGGMWEEIGKLQFEFLLAEGLREFHYFLDVGCRCLRGGVHFIRYLERGHYLGVDKSKELLDAGREIEIVRYRLMDKKAVLAHIDNFDFSSLNQRFHYALAQSVFTHLPLNSIIACVMNVERILVSGGRFYATFFENPEGKFNLQPIMHSRADGPDLTSFFDGDPYHYDFDTFRWICQGTRMRVAYIGDWQHPRDQKMLVFTKI